MPVFPRAAVAAAVPSMILPMLLAACAAPGPAAGDPGASRPGGDRAEACRMRGAIAEDRYAGPVGDLSIDSAIVRARVTEACLRQGG